MPAHSTLHLHARQHVGPVDPRVFGGFAEHMGRCIYQGLYDPDSAHADDAGRRTDVLDHLRQLDMTAMRYPGGNFASGYHWRDGVGPRENRPTTLDLAWQSIETNQFGTDEYIALCRDMGWTPMLSVNLGTGTPEEAREWVEYCNAPAGTRWADLRAQNGHAEPYGVKLWCLGNEMDGPWQIGHVPADIYARRAQQAARMMKMTDPSIQTVACGSSSDGMATFLHWDRTVLEHLGDDADFISLHRYVGNEPTDDTAAYLAVTNTIDAQIESVDAACRFVQGARRSEKRAYLCFDEWNVWYRDRGGDGKGVVAPHLLEEVYNLEDALVCAGFLQSFIRHADAVKIANLAQVVNVIAPLMTRGDQLLVQSIFHPFQMMSKRREGVSLRPAIDGPSYDSGRYGEATTLDASAVLGEGRLHVFLTNRDVAGDHNVTIKPAGMNLASLADAEVLTGPDAKAHNTFDRPGVVKAQAFDQVRVADGEATLTLPPLSFVAASFDLGA